MAVVVDAVVMKWQGNQLEYEAEQSADVCSADSIVSSIMPDRVQIATVCQGTPDQLRRGVMTSRSIKSIRMAVDKAVTGGMGNDSSGELSASSGDSQGH